MTAVASLESLPPTPVCPGPASVGWMTTREAASLHGLRYPSGFIQRMRSLAGASLFRGDELTTRALASGVVHPSANEADWIWSRDFTKALGTFVEGRTFLAETPDAAEILFKSSLQALIATHADMPVELIEIRDRFERGHAIRDACIEHGAGHALRMAMGAYAAVMATVDGRERFAATGMSKAREAFARLRRMTEGHPLVRFGLIPATVEFPDETVVSPGKGGGSLEAVAREHGFPMPVDDHIYAHPHLFAIWENGVPLAVVHRNGRKRQDAIEALLRTEAFVAPNNGKAWMRMPGIETFNVGLDAAFEAKVVRVPRNRMPTLSRTRT